MTELGQFALFVAVGTGLATLFLGPIGRALGRRLEGRPRIPEDYLAELDGRIQDLEAAQGRTAELENRLDFAERVLAERMPNAVGPGSASEDA